MQGVHLVDLQCCGQRTHFIWKIPLKFQHWIFTEFWHIASKISLSIFNLYVPVNFQEKKECWKSLVDYVDTHVHSNIIVVGDLKIMMDPKDKSGGVYGRDPMLKTMENFIQFWNFIDFKPKKGRYTWTNNREGATNISTRLDCFLVQSSFLEKKIISSNILPKLTSYHKPIMLQFEDEENIGPIPFRFSPLWIYREGFMNIVSQSWA